MKIRPVKADIPCGRTDINEKKLTVVFRNFGEVSKKS